MLSALLTSGRAKRPRLPGARAAPLVVADLRTPYKAVGKAYLEKGWFYRPALFDSGKLHVELGINPYIVQEHHKMDVRARRGSCAALVANYLSPGHILTDLHNVMIHMPVNSGNVVAVINFDCPAKPRPVPTDPDHLTCIGCHDGRSVGCRQIDAGMWFPAAAPELVFHVAEYLRNHGSPDGTLHLPGSLNAAGCNIGRAAAPDVGSPAKAGAITAANHIGRR